MSGLVGGLQDAGGRLINSVGDINLGKESLNGVVANMTLFSVLLTSLRGNVVKPRKSFDTEYDYIVIGGGTAGSIMASRLSQHPCVKVLLLEAGGEQPVLASVPGFARGLLGTSIDWSYFTAPQQYSSFGQKERRVLWNSGKVLGGSSTINAMLYVRGNKANYNQWEKEGCKGWSYDDVLPYFKKLEDNRNIHEYDRYYHSQGGPMGAEKSNYNSTIRQCVEASLVSLGFPMNDPNGATQFGVYDLQGTIRNQERCSTARAYLKPASKRENLHIIINAFVRKILIYRGKDAPPRATGVVFEHGNKVHFATIRQSNHIKGGYGEVIVSNGATRTPQLLMLSGIGPADHLKEFGIPVIANLPGVGKNLMDHYAAGGLYELDPLQRNSFTKEISPDSLAEYVFARQGPLTSISQVQVLAFLDGLTNTNPQNDFPEQQLYFLDYNTEDAVRTLNLRQDIEAKVFNPYILRPVMLCFAQLLQPRSRGEIKLQSIDPHEYPHIDPKYYSDPDGIDLKNNAEGLRICNAVVRQPAMRRLKAKWVATQSSGYPGCEGLERDEEAYLRCIALSFTITIWHPSGTARMGARNDSRSVVDPELRVIGVNNLRVVNAAVMPIIPSGNTNVPTMMIAEKGYDMVKDEILCPSTLTIHRSRQVRDRG